MTALAAPPVKPRLRGRLHQAAFIVSIPQGLALIGVTASTIARIAAGVYALSLSTLYGVSAVYHRRSWSPRALLRMKRLDHSMIFVLIAGTYTPVSLLVLRGAWAYVLLAGVWTGAAAGVAMKTFELERTRKAAGALYIVLGWVAVLAAPWIVARLSATEVALIVAGGVLYTAGAVVLLRRRPNPSPYVFGYHEVWHAMVVAASACHYAAVLLILL